MVEDPLPLLVLFDCVPELVLEAPVCVPVDNAVLVVSVIVEVVWTVGRVDSSVAEDLSSEVVTSAASKFFAMSSRTELM